MRRRLQSVLLALILLTMQLFPALNASAQETEVMQEPETAHCCGTDSELLEEMNSALLQKKALELRQQVSPYSKRWTIPNTSDNLMPSTGEVKILVLPIAYPDYPQVEEEYDEQALYDEYFAEYDPNLKISKQSVHGYYEAMSYGKLKISGEVLPVYKAPETSVYYSKAPPKENPQNGLIKSALEYYVSQGLDLAGYDSDGNGYVDALSVKYLLPTTAVAGGEDWRYWNAQIWALNDTEINGIKADSYLFSGIQDHVSTDEHEIGHLLGLLDNYSTTGACVIDNGLEEMMSCRGYYFNTYYKYLLGWIDPLVLTNENDIETMDSVELYAIEPYPNNAEAEPKAIILIPDPELLPFTEYFIIEYRNGTFPSMYVNAAFTDNPGIAVWHCNTFVNHTGHLYKSGSKYIEAVKRVGAQETYKKEDAYRKGDIFSSDSEGANSNFKNDNYTGAYMEVLDLDPDKATLKVGFREPDLSAPPTIEFSEFTIKAVKSGRLYLVPGTLSVKYNGQLLPAEKIEKFAVKSYETIAEGDASGDFSYYQRIVSKDPWVMEMENPMRINLNVNKDSGDGILTMKFNAGAVVYNGKPSQEAFSPIIYVDNTPPEIKLQGSAPQIVERGEPYTELGAKVTDNLDPDIIAGKLEDKLEVDAAQVNTAKCGSYAVTYTATDHAGNETTVEREVIVQDTTAPTATVSYSTTQPTNGDVVATITPSEPVTVTNTENGSLSYTFTKNSSFTFEFEDEAGNKGTAIATVSNIDKSLPTGTVSYDVTDFTNQNVTAKLTVDPGITILNNNGSNIHVFTENGSFEFELQNAAGTKGTVAASVTWIDKEAPVITLNGEDSLELSCVEAYEEKGAVVTDDQDGKIQEKLNITSNVQEKVPGTYTVTYSTTDHAGNAAQKKSRTVTVRHGLTQVPETDATCTKDGTAEHWICSECGKLFKDEQAVTETTLEKLTIPKRGHSPGTAADCTHDQTCTVCGTVLAEKLGHDYKDTVTPPTCTEDGYTTHTCTRCGDNYTDSETVAKGHTPGEWQVVMPATAAQEGLKRKECTVCHTVLETAVIPKEQPIIPSNPSHPSFESDPEPVPQPSVELPFTDVAKTAWYYDAVKFAYEQGLLFGTGETVFSPNQSLTRSMAVTVLYRMAGEPETDADVPFTDLRNGSYYEKAVRWAYSKGIIAGRTEENFAPNAFITRQELATLLYHYSGGSAGQDTLTNFKDSGKISGYARPALCWAVESGIVSGKGKGILDPLGKATRAETASMLIRYCRLTL